MGISYLKMHPDTSKYGCAGHGVSCHDFVGLSEQIFASQKESQVV